MNKIGDAIQFKIRDESTHGTNIKDKCWSSRGIINEIKGRVLYIRTIDMCGPYPNGTDFIILDDEVIS